MATLTAPTTASARAARPQTKVAAGSISSLRVRPFTRATRSLIGAPRQQVLARVAEPEAAAAEEFSFSLADAKRGNEYNASDVEAALRFYEGEGDTIGEVNSEFVENVFGVEDASFFDDIDNNEGYDDEFVAAGIPEAAPKQRQGRQRGGDAAADDGDSDEIVAAKDAEKLKRVEEEMVLAAELEESGLDKETKRETKAVGPAVWDWMGEVQIEDDESDVTAVAAKGIKSLTADVLDALPTDAEVFNDLRRINLQELEEETRDNIEFLLDDFDLEAELQAVPDDPEAAFTPPEMSNIQEDMSRIDALVKEIDETQTLDLDLSEFSAIENLEDDGLEMSEDAVEKYVATLRAASSAGAELSEDQVKELFSDEPLQLVDLEADAAPVSLDDVDMREPEVEAEGLLVPEGELQVEAIESSFAESVILDQAADAFEREVVALRRTPELVAPEEELSEYELTSLADYVKANEDWVEMDEGRRRELAERVARGELPEDVLEEDWYEDVETELLMPVEDEELMEEGGDMAGGEDDEDGENWQERILELTRVTKVVKGGRLMGFRCTAVVGNGKGLVGVGCQAGREIATAVKRALVDAKKSVVRVPLVGSGTVPHRVEAKFNAARCVILPAADGTGVLAGGSIRSVLELAGVQNVLAKRLGCRSLLNNARCAVSALEQLRTLQEVSRARGVPMERLLLPSRQ